MSPAIVQPRLFEPPPVREENLDDVLRTILEAIDSRGSVKPRDAGIIECRIRGWRVPRDRDYVRASGYRSLIELRELGFVDCARDGLWQRSA